LSSRPGGTSGIMDIVFRNVWMAVALVLIAGGAVAQDDVAAPTVLVVEGEAWADGSLKGVRYSPELGGLVLADPSWSPVWEVDLSEVMGADIVAVGSTYYLAGSREADGGHRVWLAAFSANGDMLWETRVREFWGLKSHVTALTVSPEGELILTGWYGNAFALAAFTPEGWELWGLSREEGDVILGTDVAVRGRAVLATAVKWARGRTQGILFCYGLDGSFRWELPLPDAEESAAVVANDQDIWVLWRGGGGWAVSRVDPSGRLEESYPCPGDVDPLDLTLQDGRPLLVGLRDGRLVVLSLAGEVLRSLSLRDPEVAVRRVTLGLGGDIAAVGWKGDRGWFALWTEDCELPWEAVVTGHAVRSLAAVPAEGGRWLVLDTDRADEEVTSRLTLWPPPSTDRRGEYASPTFPCGDGKRPTSLRVEARNLSRGTVRVILEAYADGDTAYPAVYEYDVKGEHTEVPLEMGDCARFRAIVRVTGVCPDSPVVRRLEIALGETTSGIPVVEASVPHEGAGVTPPETLTPGEGEESQLPEETAPADEGEPPVPPEASPGTGPTIVASTEVGLAGETVFSFSVSGGGDGVTWTWDFGDGKGDVGPSVRHVYAEPGVYTVSARDHRGRVVSVRVAVYRAQGVRSALPMYLPGSRLVGGDFDGDGWQDLVVWSEKAQSLFLFRGKGDGTVEFLNNRPLRVDIAWAIAADMDGDGRDDLLAGGEEAVLLWSRGSPHGLLGPAEFFTLEVTETVPVRVYPRTEGELLLLGLDSQGRQVLARVRAEGERLRASPAIVLPEASHGVSLTLGGIGGQLVEGRDAFWIDRTGSEVLTQLPGGAILALGDLDGDGIADVVARERTRVTVHLSDGEEVHLGQFAPGDLWLIGDFAGLGADQVVRIDRAGAITFFSVSPFRGVWGLSGPFAPNAATVMRGETGGRVGILIVSALGEALWLTLAGY